MIVANIPFASQIYRSKRFGLVWSGHLVEPFEYPCGRSEVHPRLAELAALAVLQHVVHGVGCDAGVFHMAEINMAWSRAAERGKRGAEIIEARARIRQAEDTDSIVC